MAPRRSDAGGTATASATAAAAASLMTQAPRIAGGGVAKLSSARSPAKRRTGSGDEGRQ